MNPYAYWWVYSPSEPEKHPVQISGLDGQAVGPVAGVMGSPFSAQHWPLAPSGQPAQPWELFLLGCHGVLVHTREPQNNAGEQNRTSQSD